MKPQKMVKATLTGTYGYFDPRRGRKEFYGPGKHILIPAGLARSLGLKSEPEPPAAVVIVGDDFSVFNLSPAILAALTDAGFRTFAAIATAAEADLQAVKGVGAQTARRIQAVAQEQINAAGAG